MELKNYQQQVNKALEYLDHALQGIQLGKASTSLLENLNVKASYWDAKVNALGHVSILDPHTMKIECWDKSELKNIEKAIYDANIGLTPKNEGEYIMVSIPPLTEERRRETAKQVKAMGEDTKAQIRRIRQDAMKETKKELDAKEISENEHKINENNIEEIIKQANTKIDSLVDAKSKEVMSV